MHETAPADNRFSYPPIDFENDLNPEQFGAVSAPNGPALVLAGAGSGKTRTLTYRVAWLLHQGVHPSEILLLTFTNKAAREMLDRVEDLTGVGRRQFWGGTFHSIAQRLLRRHGDVIGLKNSFTILDQGDSEALLKDVVQSVDKQFFKNKDYPKAKVISDILSFSRNTFAPLDGLVQQRFPYYEELKDKFAEFHKHYQTRKLEQQVVDYDDLLEYWLRIMQRDKELLGYLQNRFKHILVDEYQDTNILQSEIIDLVAGDKHNLMAVGDDAQCIYTWRGANFENIMTFPERHPGTVIYKIETNYRSTPEILTFANSTLLNQPPGTGYNKELRPIRDSRQRPYFVPSMDTTTQAHFILQRIEGLLDEGRNLGDIAILYRAHYHSMDIQMELSRRGIPYLITSGVRFFEQAHIRDLVAQLRFVSNPTDRTAFQRFSGLLPRVGPRTSERLLTLAEKIAAKEELSLFAALSHDKVMDKVPADARDVWRDMAYTLENVNVAMNGTPDAPEGQQNLFSEKQEVSESKEEPQPPDMVVQTAIDGWYADFLETIYPNWHSRREDLDSLVGFAARYDTMAELLAELVLLNSETSNRGEETASEDCLRLSTIHQAKGLEFPVVFLIGLAQGLFPLKRAIEEGDIDEERRLFYVGVTRAKDELYLSYPRVAASGGAPQLMQASAFVGEVPPEHYELLHVGHSRYI